MGQGGIQCVEQMAIGKIMLFPYVYQHHKVLAADSIIKDIVWLLLDGADIASSRIKHPLDMLRYTDDDLLAFSAKSSVPTLDRLLDKLKTRELPKRAFVFHREYLQSASSPEEKENQNSKILEFGKFIKNPEKCKQMRVEISERLSSKCGKRICGDDVSITRSALFSGYTSLNSRH